MLYDSFQSSKKKKICFFSVVISALQETDGNFPIALGSEKERNTEKRLIHWCHGASGAIYLLVKSYLVFNERRYLIACERAAELIWNRGLLRKGPGICHGIAGNGYAFLILHRLTGDPKYLYRANAFMQFLTDSEFVARATAPDRPYSLYEGVAGTVCFLLDLLNPERVCFPFMDVFSLQK